MNAADQQIKSDANANDLNPGSVVNDDVDEPDNLSTTMGVLVKSLDQTEHVNDYSLLWAKFKSLQNKNQASLQFPEISHTSNYTTVLSIFDCQNDVLKTWKQWRKTLVMKFPGKKPLRLITDHM